MNPEDESLTAWSSVTCHHHDLATEHEIHFVFLPNDTIIHAWGYASQHLKKRLFVFDRVIWRLFAHSVLASVHTSEWLPYRHQEIGGRLDESKSPSSSKSSFCGKNVEILVTEDKLRLKRNGPLLLGAGIRWFLNISFFYVNKTLVSSQDFHGENEAEIYIRQSMIIWPISLPPPIIYWCENFCIRQGDF